MAAADPADVFAALLTARLGGRPVAPDPDVAAAPPTPRLPAPNVAQGSSGIAGPPQPTGPELFEDMLRASFSTHSNDGGWWQIL
jgi:hypothetical protein